MLTETKTTTYIAGGLQVWSRYARELATHGEQADACITLWAAPQVGDENEWLYLTTNGDPVVVGVIEDGEVEWSQDTDTWRDLPEWAWIHEAIADEIG